jgi:hypothetical protein
MDTVKFVIEYTGTVTVNNEYTAELRPNRPLILEWFENNDLILDTHERIILNTASFDKAAARPLSPRMFIIKVEPSTYIIRPAAKPADAYESDLTVAAGHQVFIFPKRYTIELATGRTTTFMTVIDKAARYAIDIGLKITGHKMDTAAGKVVLKADGEKDGTKKQVLLVCDPSSGTTAHHVVADSIEYEKTEITAVEKLNTILGHVRVTKFDVREGAITERETYVAADARRQSETYSQSAESASSAYRASPNSLAFSFLQCVKYGDFENARAMLDFNTTDAHLKQYFGGFDILLNNYLGDPNTISIVPDAASVHRPVFTVAKNITFQIENGHISNIN